MPDNGYLTGIEEETEEALSRFDALLDNIPLHEPANGGPTDGTFLGNLTSVAKNIRQRSGKSPFPHPLMTSGGYQTKG